MTGTRVTQAQLAQTLGWIVGGRSGGPDVSKPVLVGADPSSDVADVALPSGTWTVLCSSSPLEIRGAFIESESTRLAVVTDCSRDELGQDLLARSHNRRVHSVNRWDLVQAMFGADGITSSLARQPELADALIEAGADGLSDIVLTSRTLDLVTVQEAVARYVFGLASLTTGSLWEWAESGKTAGIVRSAPEALVSQLVELLAERTSDGVRPLLQLVQRGDGANWLRLAVVADVVAHTESPVALLRIEQSLGEPGFDLETYREFASIALAHAKDTTKVAEESINRAANEAGETLAKWSLTDSVIASDWLPASFELRLAEAAAAIAEWRKSPADQSLAGASLAAIERARIHHRARSTPARVERLLMMARLVARGSATIEGLATLGDAVRSYENEGAWLDRARTLISRRESEPALSEVSVEMTREADAARIEQGRSLAKVLSAAAGRLPDGVRGLESVLDEVVAPILTTQPALLVVLDGMSYSNYLSIGERLAEYGWRKVKTPGEIKSAIAVLPTITTNSRTSLLAGELVSGDAARERRRFSAHSGLLDAISKAVGANQPAPVLYHKGALREGGANNEVSEIEAQIAGVHHRVVGVVINSIDERLKEVGQPPEGWGLDELEPLRTLLDAARSAGRTVIITSDHGHILERSSRHIEGRGGERWRDHNQIPAGEDEVLLNGPRVLTDSNTAVMPWKEQVRFSPAHNGYHGGLTLQELIVPVAVYRADPSPEEEDPLVAPSWWNPFELLRTAEAGPVVVKPKPRSKKKAAPDGPSLFDLPPIEAAVDAPLDGLVKQVSESALVADELTKLRLKKDEFARTLQVLVNNGGTAMSTGRILVIANVDARRPDRYFTQLQRLLNQDGVEALTVSDGEAALDVAMMKQQLELS